MPPRKHRFHAGALDRRNSDYPMHEDGSEDDYDYDYDYDYEEGEILKKLGCAP